MKKRPKAKIMVDVSHQELPGLDYMFNVFESVEVVDCNGDVIVYAPPAETEDYHGLEEMTNLYNASDKRISLEWDEISMCYKGEIKAPIPFYDIAPWSARENIMLVELEPGQQTTISVHGYSKKSIYMKCGSFSCIIAWLHIDVYDNSTYHRYDLGDYNDRVEFYADIGRKMVLINVSESNISFYLYLHA